MSTKAYAAQSATSPLAPWSLERREPKPHDVQIDILYCGVCHSDLHTVRNEWGGTVYPAVPGHEIVGRVTKVGDHVKGLKLVTSQPLAVWLTVVVNVLTANRV
jgi:uncharacterized zinc-type alcohol dehydrogenase-like protein